MIKTHWFGILLFLVAIAFIVGCTDDPDEVGLELQPGKNRLLVFFSDTSTINAYSVYEDSIKTSKTSISMLGSFYDPVFGVTNSSICSQIRLSSVAVDFGENAGLDSVILALEYTSITFSGDDVISFYGDTTTSQTVHVYEINDSLALDTSYYSNKIIPLLEPSIGTKTFVPAPKDSIYIDTIKYKAQLRIPLSEEFGNKILSATESDLSSNTEFLRFIKGLYITPEPMNTPGGGIMFFNLLSSYSRVTLYYHNDENDSLSYNFTITDASARYMDFTHNYDVADANFLAQLNGDSTLGSDKFYLQPMAGVRAKIDLPYVKDWSKIVSGGDTMMALINEAELILTNVDKSDPLLPPPTLALFSNSADGSLRYLDDQSEGTTYFGGTYDDNTGEYRFRISRYIQSLITKDSTNYGLYLMISGASLVPNRLILNGNNPSLPDNFNKRLRLNLIYTKLAN